MITFFRKLKRIYGPVSVDLLLAVGANGGDSVPTVTNPSFETGAGRPDGWEPRQGNTVRPSHGSVLAWDKEFARSGERSLYLRKESIGPLSWRSTVAVAIEPGEHYRLRVWYRIPQGFNSSVRAGVTGVPQPGQQHPWSTSMGIEPSHDPHHEWQELVMDFEAPETVDRVFISLSNGGSGRRDAEVNEVWFDDVSLGVAAAKE